MKHNHGHAVFSLCSAYLTLAVALGALIAQGIIANRAVLENRKISLTNRALIVRNHRLAEANHVLLLRLCDLTPSCHH